MIAEYQDATAADIDDHDLDIKPRMTITGDPPKAAKDDGMDHGWAWAILFGSSLGMVLIALAYTGGMFNIIFLEEFGLSKQATAWLPAVQGSLWSLTSPLSSVLTNKIGSRWTSVLAGTIGALGYFLTFFANDFTFLFVTFGLLVGTGFGIAYVPCYATVGENFKTYRNLSFGIITTFLAVGTMIFPIVISTAQAHFGWRGCMLILSGIHLQHLVSGALFRPKNKVSVSKFGSADVSQIPSNVESVQIKSALQMVPDKYESANNIVSDEQEDIMGSTRGIQESQPILDADCYRTSELELKYTETGTEALSANDEITNKTDRSKEIETLSSVRKPRVDMFETNEDERIKMNSNGMTPKSRMHFMKDPCFILLCASLFFVNIATFITYIHYPAYFVNNGASESDIAICLVTLGVANISCRLIGGIATNSSDIDVLTLYISSCGLSGIALLFCPLLAASYKGQLLFSALFGFYGNWLYSLLGPVTIKILSVEDLPLAFGMENMFGGIGGLIGPPFAGWLYDISGTYTYSIYLAGLTYLTSGIIMMLVPIMSAKSASSINDNDGVKDAL